MVDVEDARRLAEVELARWNSRLAPNRLKDPHATPHDPEDEVLVTEVEARSGADSSLWVTARSC